MIVIRKFKDQVLDSMTTWGACDAFGEFLPRPLEDSIQINVLVAKNAKKSTHSNRLGNGATAYYLFSPTGDCQAEIDELLLAHKVVGIAQLLTKRELDVIKEIFDLDNTGKVAAKLGISESTLVNHQSNISKKSGFRVREIVAMIADCSSVELLTSVVTQTITVA